MRKLLLCSAFLFVTPALADGSICGKWFTGDMSCEFPEFIEINEDSFSVYEMSCTYDHKELIAGGGISVAGECWGEGVSEGRREYRITLVENGQLSFAHDEGEVLLDRCP